MNKEIITKEEAANAAVLLIKVEDVRNFELKPLYDSLKNVIPEDCVVVMGTNSSSINAINEKSMLEQGWVKINKLILPKADMRYIINFTGIGVKNDEQTFEGEAYCVSDEICREYDEISFRFLIKGASGVYDTQATFPIWSIMSVVNKL